MTSQIHHPKLADHPFVPHHPDSTASPNSCVRCPLTVEHHPVGPDVTRDLEGEREIKDYALSLSPHIQPATALSLSSLSNERADRGPVRDLDTRDWDFEAESEISDFLNYYVWKIQQIDRREGDHSGERMVCIGVIVKCYELWAEHLVAKAESR